MPVSKERAASKEGSEQSSVRPPTISLPKGGGAIRGIGEKFAANPVTGTGSMSVPIATSPGRSGFGPQLSLSYDSGAGNGPFGLGWSLSLPSITRKTDKGLPQYFDAQDSDVFILSGAEDLVPEFEKDANDNWVLKDGNHVIHEKPRTVDSVTFLVRRYRPRIEGLFARIERWTNVEDPADTFWRSISKGNITTWYGKTAASRVAEPVKPADPSASSHIFTWLICESYDDKGNAIKYEYKPEDSNGVDLAQAHERNRGARDDSRRKANRYLKRIRYGNHRPYFPVLDSESPWPELPAADKWYFEVVFDYGEHDANAPASNDRGDWKPRNDPFSSYRAGFEIRTYRLCQRVLMFHHIPDTEGVQGYDGLVRSTDFNYSYETNPIETRNPIFSQIISVSQCGYKLQEGGAYLKKCLPPVEFSYSEATINEEIRNVDPESLENLPNGLDGTHYQWVDLDGEGLSGILTEQAQGWFYKRNLSPINFVETSGIRRIEAQFAPVEQVATKPTVSLAVGHAQFLDLAGDGQLDLVSLSGSTPGFYERTSDEGWEAFTPFKSLPVLEWDDANLKFVDLTGDGHADVLISEDNVFCWHPSLAEDGFGPSELVRKPYDEEQGPALIFADGTQSIYLADVSGDGLTDLVRIRNGEVCYWPNLGYGRFGAKVTMDNAPWFDCPDLFDHKRIRLADIDGSGTTDIIYLHRDGVRIYFNQSGNSWSAPQALRVFPRVDDVVSIVPTDLLGNGTACLVWSSPLPGDARQQMRYVDLMGGQKPHLLVKTANNLGAETTVEYAPSTKFYLEDKAAGKPWITKLPFPVHVVEKVTVTDKWRKTTFATTYSYHHGYFDGPEREFRGFGRVEQLDVESYGEFAQGNTASPYITDDKTLYQPPVKTVTWYHTGAFLDRERIFKHEYFPHWFEDQKPGQQVLGTFQENELPEPDLFAEDISGEEWGEALRACKGMMLRQEVYELDVDALERGEHRPVKLFSTVYHNCHIRCLQTKAINQHAVFLVAESEAITYHYELDLRPERLTPDPRIAHTLNLKIDDFGNVLQAVAAVYPRIGSFEDDTKLAEGLADALDLIHRVQAPPSVNDATKHEAHLAYTETRYTKDVAGPADPDNYRLRVPCEVLTYELTGIGPDTTDKASEDPRDNFYFTLDELREFRLSRMHQTSGEGVQEISYHELPNRTIPPKKEKRLVEHVRMLFFREDLSAPLPFRELGRLGVPYETYKLALTDELLNAVFKSKLDDPITVGVTYRSRLNDAAVSGYLSGAALAVRFPGSATTGQYWMRSGIAGFANDAAQHFYLPERYTDPFDNVTMLEYDSRDLFVASSTDSMGNLTRVTKTASGKYNFDYRVLAPREMKDINDNLSEVFFDVLGLPTAMAVKGKGTEGDNLTGFTDALANPDLTKLTAFFVEKPYDAAQTRDWLGNATARHVYYFGETRKADGSIAWGTHPACACGMSREQHVSQLAPGDQSQLQAGFEYSDGMGSVIVKKIQAEPEAAGQPLRWVASGKTILNNKGKPVKQYEPSFSPPGVGHLFEGPAEVGVTAVIYYDAVGRTVRTEMPDGGFSRVEFSPWHLRAFDQNDTVKEAGNAWFVRKSAGTPEEQRAAQLAAQHADTPALSILDRLGREVISVAHNRVKDAAGALKNENYLTFTKLDTEGKPLWIRDARKNLVMQYIAPPALNNQATDPVNYAPCYDIAGNLLFQHSMDAGHRWMLNDAAGKPMLAWNSRGHTFRTDYDALHRLVGSFVKGADPADAKREIQFEKLVYGDTPGNGLTNAQKTQLNLRGKPYQHHDTAGLVISKGRNPITGVDEAFDFKGNPLRSTRRLVKDYKNTPDWSQNPILESETFSGSTRYDALNRPVQLVAPHSDRPGARFNVIRPGYNEANLLERMDVWLEQNVEPTALLNRTTANLKAVTNIDYDAKGQRIRIEYNEAGHPIIADYTYDKDTFRLIRLLSTRPKLLESYKRTLQDLSYTYDPVGNITEIRDKAQQRVFFNNSLIEPSNAYAYDALYRLIRAEGREHAAQNNSQRDAKRFEPVIGVPFPNSPETLQRHSEEFVYDPVGNILAMYHTGGAVQRWLRRYQYAPDSNRLLATRLPSDPNNLPNYTATPGYSAKYTYDDHGNMTAMPHLPAMEWDFKDQLRATERQVVNDGIGEKNYYVYDAGGQRVRKVTEKQNGMVKDERIYLGGFEVFRRYNAAGNTVILERETLHIMDDKQRVALIETRTRLEGDDQAPRLLVRFQLGNHLGSAVLELNDQAQVISYEEYHPYGTTAYAAARSQTDTPKRYRYTGRERDEETGLCYHGARYYAPWLGRWTSSDPGGLIDGVNGFVYAGDDPIGTHDMNGQKGSKWQEAEVNNDPGARYHVMEGSDVVQRDTAAYSERYHQEGGDQAVIFADDPTTVYTPEKIARDMKSLDRFAFYIKYKDQLDSKTLDKLTSAMPKPEVKLPEEDKTVGMDASGRLGTAQENAERALAEGISGVKPSTGLGGAYSLGAVALGADAKEAARMGKLGDSWSPIFSLAATAPLAIGKQKPPSPPPPPPGNKSSTGGNRRLPIVNPHFTPVITPPQAFQGATLKVGTRLDTNRTLVPNYLSEGENRLSLYGPWAHRIVFGNAVERALAKGAAPTGLLIHTGDIRPFPLGGPDFIGGPGTPYNGLRFQVTTQLQWEKHLANDAPGTIYGLYR